MPLSEYIAKHYGGNNAAFARAVGKPRQRVQEWLDAGYIVSNGWAHSPRFKLPDPPQN